MATLLGMRMAKTGRPRRGESEGETTQIRVFNEMAALVSDLLLVLPLSTAQIMQRVGGANLKELHETHLPKIRTVKAAREAAEEAQKKAQAEAAAQLDEPKPKSRKPKEGS